MSFKMAPKWYMNHLKQIDKLSPGYTEYRKIPQIR